MGSETAAILTALLAKMTRGDWRVAAVPNPPCSDSLTIETAWTHGQLKAPVTVIGVGIGLGEHRETVWMRPEDAEGICALVNAAPELLKAVAENESLRADNEEYQREILRQDDKLLKSAESRATLEASVVQMAREIRSHEKRIVERDNTIAELRAALAAAEQGRDIFGRTKDETLELIRDVLEAAHLSTGAQPPVAHGDLVLGVTELVKQRDARIETLVDEHSHYCTETPGPFADIAKAIIQRGLSAANIDGLPLTVAETVGAIMPVLKQREARLPHGRTP